jgi:hypothetical protein
MKTTVVRLLGVCLSLFTIVSCQKDLKDISPSATNDAEQLTAKNEAPVSASSTPPYVITLMKANVPNGNNTFIWEWKFVNTNPGNGTNGTAQGLSHWSIVPATCVLPNTLVSAAYSANGTSWTTFTPSISPDPSSCFNTPVIKFDFGTNGNAPSYYRLIVNRTFGINNQALAYYKSGRKTGCGELTFCGMSCTGNPQQIGGGGSGNPPVFAR